MSVWSKLGLVMVVFGLLGCAHSSSSQRQISSAGSADLPDAAQWGALRALADNLDFTRPNVELAPSTGGTSVYAVIKVDGKPIGAVLPENAATVISGEIFTFHLGRAFGIAEYYQPGFFHLLRGENLNKFKTLVTSMAISAKQTQKLENRKNVLANIAKNPQGIKTVFKQFGVKPLDYDALVSVSTNSLNKTHVLKGSKSTVAQLLSCKGPQPSPSVAITANGGATTEYEAIRQISNMLLTDALTQQWDRFSGGNLQTMTENGKVSFVSIDNGGTWGGDSYTKKTLGYVSRFDRNVADQILQLDNFLNQKKGAYQGLQTEQDFLSAFGVEQFPAVLPRFKKALSLVATYIRNNPDCYF